MTRLDQNRAEAQIAARLGVPCNNVRNVIIWGNHSNTQFVDADHATVTKLDGSCAKVPEAVKGKGDSLKKFKNKYGSIR